MDIIIFIAGEIVTATREGYLMAWRTPGSPAGLEWWRGQHDEWNSGRLSCTGSITTGASEETAEERREPPTQVRDQRKEKERATGVEPATSSLGSFSGP